MQTRTICRQVGIPLLLFVAFYIAGLTGMLCESHHYDLVMSSAVFTGTFSLIVGAFVKIYHLFFG